ncbi:MAG: NAD+ synthase [Chloroflexi bacterium]|nr:NAD+ synthase [Chloroflexota bacterium]
MLRLGLAQINVVVGDLAGNSKKILDITSTAKEKGIDVLVFPELSLTGYPPEDLLLKPHFIKENLRYLDKIVEDCHDTILIVGYIDHIENHLYNSAAVIYKGKIAGTYHKVLLPNYGVFDEYRYFANGETCPVFTMFDTSVGISICEDIWYDNGPPFVQALNGALLLINISASPYHYGKTKTREAMLRKYAVSNSAAIAYCNLVGGQDELVFDGNSLILNSNGQILAKGQTFEEDLVIADIDTDIISVNRLKNNNVVKAGEKINKSRWFVHRVIVEDNPSPVQKPELPVRISKNTEINEEIYKALVLGTRDYVLKNGFQKVAIGLSGGIDSSIVAMIAVDALGASNVIGVSMPSRYSSLGSKTDAKLLAENLGMQLLTIPIEKIYQSYLDTLTPFFNNIPLDITEQNIQARIRGNLLMALSNKFNWLVLNTGNKSEIATGYTTLYGDMAGGFAVIKDVTKTMVYELARFRNRIPKILPDSIFFKVPSAELAFNQKDSDNLPSYDKLDIALKGYVEEDKSIDQLITSGMDKDVVIRMAKLVDTSEYKRRQAPPGIKITPKAFGKDRRLPITNHFREWYNG